MQARWAGVVGLRMRWRRVRTALPLVTVAGENVLCPRSVCAAWGARANGGMGGAGGQDPVWIGLCLWDSLIEIVVALAKGRGVGPGLQALQACL